MMLNGKKKPKRRKKRIKLSPKASRVLKVLKGVALRFSWAARLVIGAVLFTPILVYMVYINYTVDRQGVFQGDQELRNVVDMLLSGKNITGYEQFNERQRDILALLAEKFETPPNTIALGSSRILQMNFETAGLEDGEFFNCGLTGADFLDIIGSYYLFEKTNCLPENLIIGLDPWVFNKNSVDSRSDKTLYAEFLTNCLNIPTPYTKPDPREKWTALYSPSYFQGNISYLRLTGGETNTLQVVNEDELMKQSTEVKMHDGSILYPTEMRDKKQELIDNEATVSINYGMLNLEDYTELDTERTEHFEAFLRYVKEKGVRVFLILTPYHPINYEHMSVTRPDHYASFLNTEPTIRRIASELDIPVYGSYNPYAIPGVTNADFFDSLHCRATCIQKFFPGIPKAVENLENGVDVGLNYETTKEEAEMRDSGVDQETGSLLT